MRLLVFLFFSAFPFLGNACSCVNEDIREIIKDSKYIFTARVLAVSLNKSTKNDGYGTVVDIEILEKVKGNPSFSQLYSGFGGGDCGLMFSVGWQYLFYTENENVNICSKSGIYPGPENDDGYLEAVKMFVNSGTNFDPEDFWSTIPQLECESGGL